MDPADDTTGDVPSGHEANKPLLFHCDLDGRPVSYFAALLSSADIFSKGVENIAHLGKDAYFRCLIGLDQASLTAVLDNLEHRSNVDCMALLNGTGVDDEEQPAIEAGDDGSAMHTRCGTSVVRAAGCRGHWVVSLLCYLA